MWWGLVQQQHSHHCRPLLHEGAKSFFFVTNSPNKTDIVLILPKHFKHCIILITRQEAAKVENYTVTHSLVSCGTTNITLCQGTLSES
jgi:hypothetical protein